MERANARRPHVAAAPAGLVELGTGHMRAPHSFVLLRCKGWSAALPAAPLALGKREEKGIAPAEHCQGSIAT